MNSNNSNSKNPPNPPNPDNFFNKKNKKRKNKKQIQLQMNEEYENYLESTNKKDSVENLSIHSKSTNDLTKIASLNELSLLETQVEKETKSISSPKKQIQHKNFYKIQICIKLV